jgi:RNA-directed DNA polymerase
MAHMQYDVVRHVGELSRELLAGRYQPEPMRCHTIKKADGGDRLISVSPVRDKLVQRAALTVLEPLGEAVFHDASFGYRPNCTLEMAHARIREWVRRGWVWLGDADIQSCFDSIPHRGALRALKRLCRDAQLVDLARSWLEALPVEHRPCGADRGLPQGMVLSPFLCNLYLHALDEKLDHKGIPFVRFADDFVLLGQSEADAARALRVARWKLWWMSLALHPDKTGVVRCSPKVQFLGKRLPSSQPRFQA